MEDKRKGERRKYVPTSLDIAWAEATLNAIADEGILIFPSTALMFRVYHKERRVVLLDPEILQVEEVEEVYERTKLVFKALGYKVEVLQ